MSKDLKFIYQGVEYDATDYAEKHPGGLQFLTNMSEIKKDFTQYFRALHSDKAEKVLKSLAVVQTHKSTPHSQEYLNIYQKVQPLNSPLWSIQILLFLLMTSTWILGCISDSFIISVLSFSFTQIVVGWMGHSAAHNRNILVHKIGEVEASLLGGFSLEWWSPKHNLHHMFTNIQKYDEDIQHEYKVYLYPFLYLKWRFDSIVSAVQSFNQVQMLLIFLNYYSLYLSPNIVAWIVAELIAGFYSAFILIGNHEKEIKFKQNPEMNFIDHQIITCRNYDYNGLFWLLIMGGMQYQTEHHLFPQIPFYRLPEATKIIHPQLQKLNKKLIYGPIF